MQIHIPERSNQQLDLQLLTSPGWIRLCKEGGYVRGLIRQRGLRRGVTAIAIAALISLTMISASGRSTIAEPEFPPLAGDTLAHGEGWTLRTEEFEGNVAAGIVFSSYDRESLLAYADAARANVDAAFAQHEIVPALLTFQRPIPVEEFPNLIDRPGATTISYHIRTIEPDGRRGTIGGAPEPDGTLLDMDHLTDFTLRQEAKGASPLRVLGVIDVEVAVDRSAYEALSKLDDVFLVDLTRAVVVDLLPAQFRQQVPISEVHLEPLYWHLEDAGLAPPPGAVGS